MAMSSLGVGSGLDINSIISGLMKIEEQPLLALQKKEKSYNARISALGTLKSSLESLQTAAKGLIPSTGQTAAQKFATFSASLTDTTVAKATATTGAVAGNYSLEVTAMAQSQRLTSAAGTDSFSDGVLTIEFGTLSGSAGSYSFAPTVDRELSVVIEPGKTSIEDVRDAINAASTDGQVSATIVNGTAGKQLVLSSGDSGMSNVMRLHGIPGLEFDPDGSGFGTLSQDAINGGQAPADAALKINGIEATSSSNKVTGVIDGLSIELLKTNTGSPTSLTVSRDSTTELTTALNSFITAYNDATKSMKNQGNYDAATKTAGPLQGDSNLRGAQNQVRSLLSTSAGGTSAYQILADIGVTTQADGTLKLDATKLSKAVAADYSGVTKLVEGVGNAFKSSLEGIVGADGRLASATTSINRILRDNQSQQSRLEDRLTAVQARYTRQYSSLDSLISSMNSTSSYLTQQLASLSA